MSGRMYKQIAGAIDSVFTAVVQDSIDWYLFTRTQSASSSLYSVSRQGEKTYAVYTKVEAFVSLKIDDLDVQVYGNIVSDADVKIIIRAEELQRLGLWDTVYDKSLLTTQDRVKYNNDFYNVIKASDRGKLQAKSLICVVFAKRDIER